MNSIRQVQRLNQRELDQVVPSNASWHTDYRDTAYIYIGGLPLELSEGDVITIFSQYGEPVWIRMARDKDTGKSRGFAWLKYEDQKSCDLAVDNLGGATVMGRLLAVDHTRYQKKKDEDEDEGYVGQDRPVKAVEGAGRKDESVDEVEEEEEARPLLKEEIELAKLMREHDDDDPMKAYMIEQKKEEIEKALKAVTKTKRKDDGRRRHHRSRRDDSEDRHRSHRRRRSPDDDSSDRRYRRSHKDRSVTPRKDRDERRDRDRDYTRRERRPSVTPPIADRRDTKRERRVSATPPRYRDASRSRSPPRRH